MIKAFFAWLASLFTSSPKQIIAPKTLTKLKQGDTGPLVEYATVLLKRHGFWDAEPVSIFGPNVKAAVLAFQNSMNITYDGVIGTKETWPALQREPEFVKVEPLPGVSAHAENPAYREAKKHTGKTEFMKSFSDYISSFWPKAGLPSYKTIVGSGFAWCMVFVVAMQTEVGQKTVRSALAKDSAKIGVAIDWRKNGIPEGAIMHLNHNFNCSGGSGNHVTFADGDCTAEDLAKSGAAVPGFGGNQQNMVKRSMYSVRELCAVRWPSEIPLPGKITKSINCSGSASNESTR